uniref:NADH dehydrogenase subunit 4L n=1 Tax=Ixodes fecialis TaxID=590364 RepID=UPI001FF2E45B|nr:NADH dehydrogenase subunit 4L [Ixodes fecialis]UOK09783.1 NADH dehydrogenase subunit 4L [Ixodes fecialis]
MMETSFLLYIFGIMTFLVNRYHIMIILLSFEFMYLGVFLMMVLTLIFFSMTKMILYLIVIVCEASLGLSLLVTMNFFYGNDKLASMTILKC